MRRPWDRVAAGLALAVASMVGLVGVIAVFLSLPAGQRVDETALRGARIGRGHLIDGALTALGLISVVGLAVATGALAVIAFSRRRADLALAVVVLVGGSNATTQVLKFRVLERPALGIDTITSNSLPSGHSTVAASLAVALVLVVPTRLRGPVAAFGLVAAAMTGIATLAVGWHRPSDVIAAFFVVGVWLGVVTAGLAIGRRRTSNVGTPVLASTPRLTVVLLATLGGLALAAYGLSLWRTLGLDAIARERVDLLVAYGGGAAAVAGFAALLLAAALLVAPTDQRLAAEPALTAPGPARSR